MIKKTWIRIWIVLVIVTVMWFSDWSFAAEVENEKLGNRAYLLYVGIDFLSWGWILLAKVAGTFLTNGWVYWEYLWLDVLLWKYRNIVRNIANFGLWFYFICTIWKWLIDQFYQWKDSITKDLKNILLWLLVAGVWIQSSWFLTAAVVDVSTITLAAVGSFPSQVISENVYIEWLLEKSLTTYFWAEWGVVDVGKKISALSEKSSASKLSEIFDIQIEPIETTQLIDAIMPNSDDVSWPLYFLWFSILETHKLPNVWMLDENSMKVTILNLLIQWWTTIVYAIEMGVLCVVALIRIIYLWMFIVLSPLAILLRCIQKSWGLNWWKSGKEKWFLSSLMEQVDFKTFLVNVFKPTIIVLWFWIAVIFVSLMSNIVKDYDGDSMFDINWVTLTSSASLDSSGKEIYTTTMDNDIVTFSLIGLGKTLLQLILSILTVIGVYLIIKFSVTFGNWKDFASSKFSKVQENVEWLMTSMPIVPVAWYDKEWVEKTRYMSAKSIVKYDKAEWKFELLDGKLLGQYKNELKEINDKQGNLIASWFENDQVEILTANEMSDIEKVISKGAGNGLKRAKTEIDSIKSDTWKWMTLNRDTAWNQGFWIKQFENWLEKSKDQRVSWIWNDDVWNEMIRRWNDGDNKNQGLEQLFKQNEAKNVKAYADLFGLGNITSWEELKNKDISKKE